jgi:hypothetical protein
VHPDHLAHVYQFYLADWFSLDRALRPTRTGPRAWPAGRATGPPPCGRPGAPARPGPGRRAGLLRAAPGDITRLPGPGRIHLLVHRHAWSRSRCAPAEPRPQAPGLHRPGVPGLVVGGCPADLEPGGNRCGRSCAACSRGAGISWTGPFSPTWRTWPAPIPHGPAPAPHRHLPGLGDLARPAGDGDLFPNGVFTWRRTGRPGARTRRTRRASRSATGSPGPRGTPTGTGCAWARTNRPSAGWATPWSGCGRPATNSGLRGGPTAPGDGGLGPGPGDRNGTWPARSCAPAGCRCRP